MVGPGESCGNGVHFSGVGLVLVLACANLPISYWPAPRLGREIESASRWVPQSA
jgi:hypothetical protein